MNSLPNVANDGARPIHVLTLTPFYPSDSDDSQGCFVAEPLDALAAAGVVNSVFAVQPFYRDRPRDPRVGVAAHWLRYFSLPGGSGLPSAGAFLLARIVSRIRDLQKSGKVDLIHAHAALPCGHAAMLLNAELGLPYVVSVHGLDTFSTEQVKGRAGEWCRRISRRVYSSSRRVVCVSEHVREQVLQGMGASCRTSVVYNGVDAEMFSPETTPTDAASSAPVVLSVGNLIPIKGHELLIRAVAAVSLQFPELKLEIIGDGVERPRLEDLVRKINIADRVRFLGRKSRRAVAESMRRCTLFALPSRYEALGCVYLEAMACGKPVIGCRGQGIGEIVRHGSNGFLIGPDNEKELTLAIAMLLRDQSLRHNLGRRARETVLDRLTLQQTSESLSRIYRESLK